MRKEWKGIIPKANQGFLPQAKRPSAEGMVPFHFRL